MDLLAPAGTIESFYAAVAEDRHCFFYRRELIFFHEFIYICKISAGTADSLWGSRLRRTASIYDESVPGVRLRSDRAFNCRRYAILFRGPRVTFKV